MSRFPRVAGGVAVLAVISALVVPAGASAATGSLSTSWGYGKLTAGLSGPDISIKASVTDKYSDGSCVYVEAKIVRSYATDPNKKVATACGSGVTKSGSWNYTSWYGSPQYVELKLCKDQFGIDPCVKKNVSFN